MKNSIVRMTLVVGAFFLISSFAQAAITDYTCTFPNDPTGENHDWIFELDDNGTPSNTSDDFYSLTLTEVIEACGPDNPDGVVFSGIVDEDPIIHYTKTITNNTDFEWTGYELILKCTCVSFDYSNLPTSSVFTFDEEASDLMKIVFSSPNTVAIGGTVILDFDVLVPDSGSFKICLEQIAIPEPATMLLLGLGGLIMFRRKRV